MWRRAAAQPPAAAGPGSPVWPRPSGWLTTPGTCAHVQGSFFSPAVGTMLSRHSPNWASLWNSATTTHRCCCWATTARVIRQHRGIWQCIEHTLIHRLPPLFQPLVRIMLRRRTGDVLWLPSLCCSVASRSGASRCRPHRACGHPRAPPSLGEAYGGSLRPRGSNRPPPTPRGAHDGDCPDPAHSLG